MKYYVYILRCSDDTLYTGITTDLKRRVNEHNGLSVKKIGSKYTAMRRPVKVIYFKKLEDRSKASKEEFRIKKLKKNGKEKLISSKNS